MQTSVQAQSEVQCYGYFPHIRHVVACHAAFVEPELLRLVMELAESDLRKEIRRQKQNFARFSGDELWIVVTESACTFSCSASVLVSTFVASRV